MWRQVRRQVLTSGGRAVLALWVDIDPEDQNALEDWHSHEHVQERVGCPGWLRGSRFKAVTRPGRFLLLYDAETIEAFDSAAYYARLQTPTALSRAIFPKFRSTSRTACTVERRQGGGIAAAVLALRPAVDVPIPFDSLAAWKPARLDLLRGHESVGQAHTTEKDLRHGTDRRIERALLAFFPSTDDAERARAAHAPSAEIFALRHTLSKSDLGLSSGDGTS